MTAQIPDKLLLQDQILSIVGVNGSGMFNPYDFGLQPLPRITSCWRGYVCEYKLEAGRFLLHKLQVNLDSEGPSIHGVRPTVNNKQGLFSHIYNEINLPVAFSGGILAAGDFIQDLYVHMGFHPAWKYKTVFELVLSQGNVLETRDVSEEIEKIRAEMVRSPLQPGVNATKEQIEKWVTSTFKQDYNF